MDEPKETDVTKGQTSAFVSSSFFSKQTHLSLSPNGSIS